ncbi:glycosyltransferase [uncultured Arthrobacter sp.]|uniref:glycosyltransferase n=1 Tax=uncultured Arthrobacter sp. TaxID=114050 RepID=UPI002631FC5A|nr:glycosyltransferase [uncultured Arthrobacter sp.]
MKIASNVKPHLLYIGFAYPPSTASSVYRSLAVPNAFAAAGWDVTVLTIDGETWSEISGVDTGLLDSIDSSVQVVRVSDGGSEDHARGDLRDYSRLRIEAPYVWERLKSLRSRRSFPEAFHGLWLKPASKAAREVHRHHPVNLVIASASPYVSFAVARSLPDVPYVLDYRDAWAFNTITGSDNFSPRSSNGKLEATFLQEALQVWFVNAPIQDEYVRRYPATAAKMRVVPNGFDPQPGHGRPTARRRATPSFGYLGTLQHENNPLDAFLDGWVEAFGLTGGRKTPAATAQIRGKLSSSGSAAPELLRRFDGVRRHGIEYGGPVPKREVARFYKDLDALILLLASGKYVTGGKTAEYLATGLPIVSAHEHGNAATDLLRDYPLWFPATELTATGISAALRRCAQQLQEPDEARWSAAWDYGQSFLRSTLMAPVIEELTRSVGFPLPGLTPPDAGDRKKAERHEEAETKEPRAGRQVQAPGGPDIGAARDVRVLVVMDDASREVLEDVRARASSIRTVSLSLVEFAANYTHTADGSHTLSLAPAGRAERMAYRLSSAGGPVGMLSRLCHDNLRSRRLALAVLKDRTFGAELRMADVVMAADTRAIRAVWQLRSRTQADLVRGVVALVHVLKR